MRRQVENWVAGLHARHCSRRRIVAAYIVVWAGLAVCWIAVAFQ